MTVKSRGWFFTIVLTLLTISMTYFLYVTETAHTTDELKRFITMAAVSMDPDKLEDVNAAILSKMPKMELLQHPAYTYLVHKLNKITNAMPIPSLWSYIIYPASPEDLRKLMTVTGNLPNPSAPVNNLTVLSILTVAPSLSDPKTLPGTVFDMSKYPAMIEAVNGSSNLVISELVHDDVYDTWNRAGFIKIYNPRGLFVGVLAVELSLQAEIKALVNSLVYALFYSTLVFVRIKETIKPSDNKEKV